MKETKLYAKLRPQLIKWGQVDRVENVLGSGMSDIFYNIAGSVGWIETKVAKGDMIYFEKFQPNWINKHLRQGFKRMFVMVLDKRHTIHLWYANEILAAPRVPYEKWQVVNINDLPEASVVLEPPYRNWDDVYFELID